ncbi:polymer-forming cytoskeletal protein [Halocatena salina]|uniref:Polymer-forming cytoskeletal protein n=1 Tax=Halocatena salina TaxID=2934340 RepID=A0A8U0A8D1_9EURY|nr:polymer-forming cytoskeletal protein [Halocatena salina]UPM45096.1 polymer-forming cytoskeletal protein [Halocatena salina]
MKRIPLILLLTAVVIGSVAVIGGTPTLAGNVSDWNDHDDNHDDHDERDEESTENKLSVSFTDSHWDVVIDEDTDDVRAAGNVSIKPDVEIDGTVETDGNVDLGDDAEVDGDIVTDGDVTLRDDTEVDGTVTGRSVSIATDAEVDGAIRETS